MMPFGGKSRAYTTRSILHFKRVAYIIESRLQGKIAHATERDVRIDYSVERFDARGGPLATRALQMINEADIVIGLLIEPNINVAYELAFRNVIRDLPLLLAPSNDGALRPVYFDDIGFIDYPVKDHPVADTIEMLVNTNRIFSLNDSIPETLKAAIEQDLDKGLEDALQQALQRIERDGPQQQLDVVPFVPPPPRVLKEWTQFYPVSVVETKWRKKRDEFEYHEDDMAASPRVVYWNSKFLDLFDLNIGSAQLDSLTLEYLLRQLKQLMTDASYAEFEADQIELTKEIVYKDGFGTVRAPIKLSTAKENYAYNNKTLLPCLIAKWADRSDLSRPHRVYLVVAYIDISRQLSGSWSS
jgi:hypothetical protein